VNTRVLVAAAIVVVSVAFPQFSRAQNVLSRGIWIDRAELMLRPMSGTAWTNLLNNARVSCPTPDLSDQEDTANVCVMAKALVFARTGEAAYRLRVVDAIWAIVNSGVYRGRALALGRELAAYPIAADLIDLKNYDRLLDSRFRQKLAELLTTPTTEGPRHLIECHELRPNNWGTHCGASRAAVAAYLGDTAQLARTAKVFKGYLGDRSSYAGFKYGDLSWQCNPGAPVGINPMGCQIGSYQVGGVLPEEQRRAGGFSWPPPKENYVYEGLQGAMAEAVILKRAGYDVFNWQNKALLRAFQWLQTQANFLAEGDDVWLPHLVNYFYGRGTLPAVSGTRPGKNVGWTDWTHSGVASTSSSDPSAPSTTSLIAGTYTPYADAYVRGGTSASTNFGRSTDLDVKDSNSSSDGYHRHAFMQFRVGKGSVSRATLRAYVSALPNGTPAPVCVFGIPSDDWTETTITWANKPAAVGLYGCKKISATGWVTWDVTSLVKAQSAGDGVVSLVLADSTHGNRMARFDSREGEKTPVIVVD
jgi:hypothetical protein